MALTQVDPMIYQPLLLDKETCHLMSVEPSQPMNDAVDIAALINLHDAQLCTLPALLAVYENIIKILFHIEAEVEANMLAGPNCSLALVVVALVAAWDKSAVTLEVARKIQAVLDMAKLMGAESLAYLLVKLRKEVATAI